MIDADFLRRKRGRRAATEEEHGRRKGGRTVGRVIILVGRRRRVGGGGGGAPRRGLPFGKSGTITPVYPRRARERSGRGVCGGVPIFESSLKGTDFFFRIHASQSF